MKHEYYTIDDVYTEVRSGKEFQFVGYSSKACGSEEYFSEYSAGMYPVFQDTVNERSVALPNMLCTREMYLSREDLTRLEISKKYHSTKEEILNQWSEKMKNDKQIGSFSNREKAIITSSHEQTVKQLASWNERVVLILAYCPTHSQVQEIVDNDLIDRVFFTDRSIPGDSECLKMLCKSCRGLGFIRVQGHDIARVLECIPEENDLEYLEMTDCTIVFLPFVDLRTVTDLRLRNCHFSEGFHLEIEKLENVSVDACTGELNNYLFIQNSFKSLRRISMKLMDIPCCISEWICKSTELVSVVMDYSEGSMVALDDLKNLKHVSLKGMGYELESLVDFGEQNPEIELYF